MRYTTQLEVDFSLLQYNFDLITEKVRLDQIIFMTKANAYGHGLFSVSEFAHNEIGVQHFGVATLAEAVELRQKLPTLKRARIFVFSDNEILNPDYNKMYLEYDVMPVIFSLETLQFVLENNAFRKLPLVVKIDTGMNRLGIKIDQIEQMISALKKQSRPIKHLMTHFSSSFLAIRPHCTTLRQLNQFQELKKELSANNIDVEETSCSNSGAIEQGIGLEESFVRPGLMLYGPASVMQKNSLIPMWKGKSISSLKSDVIHKFEVKKGTPIGYGGHVCHTDGTIVYIPAGYADGILTYYSGIKLKHTDYDCQILGRINMDMTAVFFPGGNDKIKLGDEFRFWHQDQMSVQNFCHQAKTTPYQLFTAITSRVPRSYHK